MFLVKLCPAKPSSFSSSSARSSLVVSIELSASSSPEISFGNWLPLSFYPFLVNIWSTKPTQSSWSSSAKSSLVVSIELSSSPLPVILFGNGLSFSFNVF